MRSKRESPTLIGVMGATGAGKSTFVQLVTGNKEVQVGHNLRSMTSEIQSYEFQYRGKTFTIVDTPGFDDSDISDKDILVKILVWLKKNYQEQQKLAGLLYLHRIDAPRMQGSALRNFRMFKELCGEDFYKNICLATTCWSQLKDQVVGEQRECQLKDEGGFWHSMIQRGSQIARITGSQHAASEIVFQLASRHPGFLKSQEEMGVQGLTLDELSATKVLDSEIQSMKEEHQRKIREEQERLANIQRDREAALKAEFERKRRDEQKRLRAQEIERYRLLRLEQEKEDQRQRDMRALEENMRRMRLEEEGRRKREQEQNQKKLDDCQFALDYQLLIRAHINRRVKAPVKSLQHNHVCDNCYRYLENETYVECPKSECATFKTFVLCKHCKPLSGVYCPGGSAHWPLVENQASLAFYDQNKQIGDIFCHFCQMKIGPMVLECWNDRKNACPECTRNGRVCCKGSTMWIERLKR